MINRTPMSASDTNLLISSRNLPTSPGGDSADSAPVEEHIYEEERKAKGLEEEYGDDGLKAKLAGVHDESGDVVMAMPASPPPLGNAGFASSCVNLLKTIIGAGMLSLPFAFSLVGIFPGTALLVLATAMTIFGLYLLAKASYEVCDRTGSFAALSAVSYPRLTPLFDLAVALKCLGVSIGYLKIIGDLLPATIKGFQSSSDESAWYLNRIIWVSAITAGIAPVTFMKRMDSLKYTSFLGLMSVVYLLVLSVVMYIQTIMTTGSIFGYGALITKLDISSFRAFPIMVFAFCCHQNLFPIQNEARKNAPRPMLLVINICTMSALVIYLLFATGSYATWNVDPAETPINANIINNYPTKGVQYILARFLYIFLLTFSYPMMTFPTRASILKIFGYYGPEFYQSHRSVLYYSTTVFIVAFTWLIACINPPLDFVLGLIGSTAAPVICFFLPAVFWLKIDPKRSRTSPLRIGCIVLIAFAVLSTALSLTSLILSVVVKSQ